MRYSPCADGDVAALHEAVRTYTEGLVDLAKRPEVHSDPEAPWQRGRGQRPERGFRQTYGNEPTSRLLWPERSSPLAAEKYRTSLRRRMRAPALDFARARPREIHLVALDASDADWYPGKRRVHGREGCMGANRELLERAIDAENRGDFQALALLWATDAVRIDPMQTLRGRDAIIDFYRRTRESMPDVYATVDRTVEEGDCMAWEVVASGTNTGPLHLPAGHSLPPTGRRTEQRIAGFSQIRDGQCVLLRIYFDQLETLRQLGFMPAPALAIGGVGGVLGGVWATRVRPLLRDWRSRAGR